eukprot:g56945.t1
MAAQKVGSETPGKYKRVKWQSQDSELQTLINQLLNRLLQSVSHCLVAKNRPVQRSRLFHNLIRTTQRPPGYVAHNISRDPGLVDCTVDLCVDKSSISTVDTNADTSELNSSLERLSATTFRFPASEKTERKEAQGRAASDGGQTQTPLTVSSATAPGQAAEPQPSQSLAAAPHARPTLGPAAGAGLPAAFVCPRARCSSERVPYGLAEAAGAHRILRHHPSVSLPPAQPRSPGGRGVSPLGLGADPHAPPATNLTGPPLPLATQPRPGRKRRGRLTCPVHRPEYTEPAGAAEEPTAHPA